MPCMLRYKCDTEHLLASHMDAIKQMHNVRRTCT